MIHRPQRDPWLHCPPLLWLALTIGLLPTPVAQAQWAFSVGGLSVESGQALAVTSNDEVIVTGWSRPEADWDPSPDAEAFIRTGSGFLARYRADGSLAWVRGLPTYGEGVALDDDDEIFVVSSHCDLRRFSPEGEERWAVRLGSDDQTCRDVAFGGAGFLHVAGSQGYLARVNPENGDVFWSHLLGNRPDRVEGLVAHRSGAVTMTGTFDLDFDADPGEGENVLTATDPPNIFLASFDSEGNSRWARTLSASGWESVYQAGMDEHGAIYITGGFGGTMDFGSGPIIGNNGSYIAKYDSLGRHAWTRAAGRGVGLGISVNRGLVAVAGASTDFFVAQFDTAGTYHWIRGLTTLHGFPWAIGLDSMGAVFLSGIHREAIDFDPGPGVFEVDDNGRGDGGNFFLARSPPGGAFAVNSEPDQPVTAGPIHLSVPYPHPVRGRAVFTLTLDRPQPVRIVLTDMLGRRVRVLASHYLLPGTHEIGADLSGLPAGLYLAHVEGSRAVSRVLVVQ
jgi:PQQ-like domain